MAKFIAQKHSIKQEILKSEDSMQNHDRKLVKNLVEQKKNTKINE